MASAGRVGVGIGTGAAGGAMTGASFGPWGAVIGGGIGAIGGAVSSLLSSSDEAKERKRAMDEYQRQRDQARNRYIEQERNRIYDEWERRYAARTGLSQDPMYLATHHDTFDPAQAAADFEARAGEAPTLPAEPAPNYGALVQSLGSLGATVGGLSRQADAQSRLDDLIQSRRIAATGNPWQSFADTQQGDDLEKLLEKARADAWNRTGGW